MSATSMWGYAIAVTILVVLLGGMFFLLRAMSDESGKYGEIKEMLDSLFSTPSFLRPGSDPKEVPPGHGEAAAARTDVEPFEDECPACRARVTHEHAECPSCGLRLMD